MSIRITRQKRKGQLEAQGRKADERSRSEIAAAGWTLASVTGPMGWKKYVASKRVIEDDHSITMKYESSYTLGGLALSVRRREREAA